MERQPLDSLGRGADSLLRQMVAHMEEPQAKVLLFDQHRRQAVDMLTAVAVDRSPHSLGQVVQGSQQFLVFVHRELHWDHPQTHMPAQHIDVSFVLRWMVVERRPERAKRSPRTRIAESRTDRTDKDHSARVRARDIDVPAEGGPWLVDECALPSSTPAKV